MFYEPQNPEQQENIALKDPSRSHFCVWSQELVVQAEITVNVWGALLPGTTQSTAPTSVAQSRAVEMNSPHFTDEETNSCQGPQ